MALFVLSKRHNEKAADLFAAYGTMFYGRALSFVHDKQAAEDLVQSAMLELMKSFDKGSEKVCTMDDERLPGYVVGIIRKLYYNNYKKAKHEAERVEKLGRHLAEGFSGELDPEERILFNERMDLVGRAALRLSERSRMYLQMRFIHSFDNAKIAEMLNIKEASVPMVRKRTLDELKRLVAEEEREECLV